MYEAALDLQLSLEQDHLNIWIIQQSIASCYYHQDKPLPALKLLKEIEQAQLETSEIGQEDIHYRSHVSTFHQMGLCYASLDFNKEPAAYEKAKICYARALDMARDRAPSANDAAVHRHLGDLHRKQGLHMEAAESYEAASQFSRAKRGVDFFRDLVLLGIELRLAGAWDKQKAVLLERLAWTREHYGVDSEEVMFSIGNLATNAENLKEFESSLEYRTEELRLQRIFNRPDQMLDCMMSVFGLSFQLGQFETSRSMVREVLKIRRTLNISRTEEMRLLSEWATVEVELKNYGAPLDLCRQVIDFYGNVQELFPELIATEIRMSRASLGSGKLEDAEAHATRAVVLRAKFAGADDISTVKARFLLAEILFRSENYDQAARLFERCIPSLQNLESPPPRLKQFWEEKIDFAKASLEICRSKSS